MLHFTLGIRLDILLSLSTADQINFIEPQTVRIFSFVIQLSTLFKRVFILDNPFLNFNNFSWIKFRY